MFLHFLKTDSRGEISLSEDSIIVFVILKKSTNIRGTVVVCYHGQSTERQFPEALNISQ